MAKTESWLGIISNHVQFVRMYRRRHSTSTRVTASTLVRKRKELKNDTKKQTDQKNHQLGSWFTSGANRNQRANRLAPLVGAVRGNRGAGGRIVRQRRVRRNYPRIKIAKGDLAMKIHVNVIPSPAELVTVHKREPINRVIDRLRKLDDRDFDKSVKAAKWLRIFDKGMKWIEDKFYGRK